MDESGERILRSDYTWLTCTNRDQGVSKWWVNSMTQYSHFTHEDVETDETEFSRYAEL